MSMLLLSAALLAASPAEAPANAGQGRQSCRSDARAQAGSRQEEIIRLRACRSRWYRSGGRHRRSLDTATLTMPSESFSFSFVY